MQGRKVLILYGSETGNAQDFAETLALNCRYRRFQPTVSAMDDFAPRGLLDYQVLLVICSTTGQGDLPRNSQRFWHFLLRKKLPSSLLAHMRFSTFGLGDSSYSRYNWAIRKIHARLLQLGAKEFCPRGECNEQAAEGPEAYYAAWANIVLEKLPSLYPSTGDIKPIADDAVLPPSFKLEVQNKKFKRLTDADIKGIALQRMDDGLSKAVSPCKYEIVTNERITAKDHFQDVRKLILRDNSHRRKSLNLNPGDTLAFYPTNDPKDVNAFIKIQGWEDIADFPLKIEPQSASSRHLTIPGGGFVKKLTLRSLITHHIDIMSVPRRSFFMQVANFASDKRERDKLKEFTSLSNAQDLYDYADRPRRSILEVVQEFFSLKIPLDYILDVFPLIKPRLFSISSMAHPGKSADEGESFELTIAIVEYKTIIRRLRRGLCTHWIKSLNPGDVVLGTIQHSRSKFHLEPHAPIIMAYTGTGVAPVKCYVEAEVAKKDSERRPIYLFSGNRYPDKDFLYGDLWKKWQDEKKINLYPAFSRDPEYRKKGMHYIVDTLYKQKKLVNSILTTQNGGFYLCGSSGKMPIEIRITMESILQEENEGWTEKQAKDYLAKLEATGRYIQDTW